MGQTAKNNPLTPQKPFWGHPSMRQREDLPLCVSCERRVAEWLPLPCRCQCYCKKCAIKYPPGMRYEASAEAREDRDRQFIDGLFRAQIFVHVITVSVVMWIAVFAGSGITLTVLYFRGDTSTREPLLATL